MEFYRKNNKIVVLLGENMNFDVEKAIRKYVKNPEHFTEIYNRCYEAVAKAIRETQEKQGE